VVVFGEEAGPFGEGKINEDDFARTELFPESGWALDFSDAIGFGFSEDRSVGVEGLKSFPEEGLKLLLGWLEGIGPVAEDGPAVVGEALEVENLGPLFFQFVKEAGLAATGESGEDDKVGRKAVERRFEVLDEEMAPSLVAAVEHAGPPPDGAEDQGHRLRAQVASPTVEERGKGVGLLRESGVEVPVNVAGDQGRSESSRFVGIGSVDETNSVAFLVVENRQIDRAGEMVLGEFGRRTHVDDVREIREEERRTDAFGKFHEFLLLHLDDEADFHRDAQRKRRAPHGGAGVFADLPEDLHEKVGGPVDDLGMISEIGGGVDKAGDGHHAGHPVERAEFGLDHGEAGEHGETGSLLGFLHAAFAGDLPKVFLIAHDGESSGDVEELAGVAGIEVGAERGGDFGEGKAQGL
jgi:hypothetical protein